MFHFISAPIMSGRGNDLAGDSDREREDKRRTFYITYNNSFFEDNSFGNVTNKGFIVLDVSSGL